MTICVIILTALGQALPATSGVPRPARQLSGRTTSSCTRLYLLNVQRPECGIGIKFAYTVFLCRNDFLTSVEKE